MSKAKDKLKRLIPIGIMSTSALIIALNITIIANTGFFKKNQIINDPKFDGITQYLEHSDKGVPLTLPLDKNNPITVAVNNFSETDRQKVLNAIQSLDNVSENINFKISNDTNIKVDAQININGNHTNQATFTNQNHTMGCAKYSYNSYTGEISYPINIYIQPMENYNFVTDYTLDYIIKHELGHALGFKDLNAKEYENKSIMYHEINYNININDYSELDKANIQQLYDNKKIIVEKPSTLQVFYKKQEELEI